MNEQKQLAALARYLKASGPTSLTSADSGQLGLRSHTLTHRTDGNVPFTWPMTGVVDFSFSWDDNTNAWSCTGGMYDSTPSGANPKVWFHQVAKNIKAREQILKDLLQRCATLWERYRGDLEQFSYRLGVETSGTAHVSRMDTAYCWTHTAHPDIRMFFSPDPVPTGYGRMPQSRYGWYPAPATHKWEMSVTSFAQMRADIIAFSKQAVNYCEGASACFGQNDSEAVAAR